MNALPGTTASPGEFANPLWWELPGPPIPRVTPRPVPIKGHRRGMKVPRHAEIVKPPQVRVFGEELEGPLVVAGDGLHDYTPWGPVALGEWLYSVPDSVVFSGAIPRGLRKRGMSTVDVKYASDCALREAGDDLPEHPLARDARISEYLSTFGITEQVPFVSSASTLIEHASLPLHLRSIVSRGCTEHRGQIRFSIRQPSGVPLSVFVQSALDALEYASFVGSVLRFAMEAVDALELMHRADVVHGGISATSFRVIGDASSGLVESVKLVDFERSFRRNSRPGLPIGPAVEASVAELSGQPTTSHADMFHLFEIVADVLSHGTWSRELGRATEHEPDFVQAALDFKNDNLFLPHSRADTEACPRLGLPARMAIQTKLESVVNLIVDPEWMLDHSQIHEIVQEALICLSPSSPGMEYLHRLEDVSP